MGGGERGRDARVVPQGPDGVSGEGEAGFGGGPKGGVRGVTRKVPRKVTAMVTAMVPAKLAPDTFADVAPPPPNPNSWIPLLCGHLDCPT